MPRTFIPQVDDANAEIVRLDGALDLASQKAVKDAADLKAANDLNAEAQIDLTKIRGEKTTLEGSIVTLQAELKTAKESVTTLQTELITAKGSATKTIAKAGVVPVKEEAKTGIESVDNADDSKKLTGLQRAMAANIAAQKAKVTA
jgi:hypothetical protein